MTFAVLLVCTGNLCRSAAAEQLLAQGLGRSSAVELLSAGTHAQDGAPIHPLTARALAEVGCAPSGHRAQRLVPAAVSVADLVLTATREHRVAVVEADPAAVTRTFTVLEFARLVRAVDAPHASLVDLRARAAAERSAAPATTGDDLSDPIRGDFDAHARMVRTLAPAVLSIVEAFRRCLAPV